jgi:hypothetical protein
MIPENLQLYFNTHKIIVDKTPLGVLDMNTRYNVMDRFYEIHFQNWPLFLFRKFVLDLRKVCEQYIIQSDWIHLDRGSVYWKAVLMTVSIGRLY